MIGFSIFKIFENILMLFPHSMRKSFFIMLSKIAYTIDKKHRKVVNINLDIAFNNSLSQEKKDEIAASCYKNLLMNFLHIIEAKRLTNEDILKKVTFVNKDVFDQLSSKQFILSTAHYGNWELLGVAVGLHVPQRSNAVFKKLNNSYFNEYLKSSREKFGLKMIEKRGALKYLTKALKNGEGLALLVDQNTNERDGIPINMFSKQAYQSASTSLLARKYDAPIIPTFITTEDYETYTITFHNPIFVDKTDNQEADILKATQMQADILQEVIKQEPKGWFWCHKRWKTGNAGLYD
ncbi:MAG: lipid A biosynthesis lauroyl acyltransferase [Campylobacterota bacterium]|nr:lipid A biosynthesis lauroyl acyltransferase [Campylobacterota bacterium]